MGAVLKFPARSGSSHRPTGMPHPSTAEIFIFTGVRYERWAEADLDAVIAPEKAVVRPEAGGDSKRRPPR
jgi:hypothetical protein